MLLRDARHDDVIQLVADVEQWTTRIDDKTTGWLALCDAHLGKGNTGEAKRCLRRLDVSGVLQAERAAEVTDRLAEIERRIRAVEVIDAGVID